MGKVTAIKRNSVDDVIIELYNQRADIDNIAVVYTNKHDEDSVHTEISLETAVQQHLFGSILADQGMRRMRGD